MGFYDLSDEDREIYLDLFCGWRMPAGERVQHPDEYKLIQTDEEKAALAYER